MRKFGLSAAAAAIALLAAGQAAAQGATGFSIGDFVQRRLEQAQAGKQHPIPPSALNRLSKGSRLWIRAEAQRQAKALRAPAEVALDIETNLYKDIYKLAKRERLDMADVSNAILLKVMIEADADADRELRKARRAVKDGGDPALVQVAEERSAQSKALLREALSEQSQASLVMAGT